MGIQGFGGVGKSTLAAYFYQSLDIEAKFWADVSLKPDFTVFAEKIILALGGKVTQPIDITQLINNLLDLLSQRRCLLVVDNLETLLNKDRNWQDEYYQQFFSRWLQQGTNSTLFITTQDKPQLFQGSDYWHTLGGMKIEEGIALLNNLEIQGTEAELKAFVEYVDGHPLTIKLVAGFLKEYCDSQLSQVEELELKQFELAYEEAEGAHRSKQDARLSWIIERHLKRLNSEQKQFLTNVSVYRLPFSREAASYMFVEKDVKKYIIQKKLIGLCNRSLLRELQDNKFQFESLVQKYILRQANDLTNAHQQAIEYYQANLKEEESWELLEDVSEYLEIIDHRCELKQYAEANKILDDSCYDFLARRGYYGVLVEIYKKLVQGWQPPNLQPEERSNYASSLKNLGNAYYYLGEYQQAIDSFQQSLKIKQEIGDRNGEAKSLNNLGSAYNSLGEYQQAIDYLQQSLEITREIGDRNGEAKSLNNLGNAYYYLGKYQQAIDSFQQSLKIKQEIGDRNGEAKSLNNLGSAYYYLGKYQQAIDYLQQSLEITREIGDRYGEANSLIGLGNAYNSQGDYPQAIDYYQKSLKITRKIGDRYGEACSLNNLGDTRKNLQQKSEAKTAYENARKLYQAMGLDKKVAECDKAIQSLEEG